MRGDMCEHFLARHASGEPVGECELHRLSKRRVGHVRDVVHVPLVGLAGCKVQGFERGRLVGVGRRVAVSDAGQMRRENSVNDVNVIEQTHRREALGRMRSVVELLHFGEQRCVRPRFVLELGEEKISGAHGEDYERCVGLTARGQVRLQNSHQDTIHSFLRLATDAYGLQVNFCVNRHTPNYRYNDRWAVDRRIKLY